MMNVRCNSKYKKELAWTLSENMMFISKHNEVTMNGKKGRGRKAFQIIDRIKERGKYAETKIKWRAVMTRFAE